jgi:predicted double-glycine peptidase
MLAARLGVRIQWVGGGGHFVVIGGYSLQNVVDVRDPWYGNSSVDYTAFKGRYQGHGRWSHSYQTIPGKQNSG